MKFSVYLPPQSGQEIREGAGALLSVRAHLHRGDLSDQGPRAAGGGGARAHAGRAGHQSARAAVARRCGQLGFRAGRGLLCGCHPGAVVDELPDVQLRDARAARDGGGKSCPRTRPRRASSAIPWAATARSSARCRNPRIDTNPCPRSRRSRRRCNVPGARKAFGNYLGPDQNAWREYDASELVARKPFPGSILIDQGSRGSVPSEQLLPEKFAAAADKVRSEARSAHAAGYDHGYYFIQTFMADHLRHHAAVLKKS